MMIELNSWETRIVLEALRRLDAEWNAVIDGTEDEDIQSEYGNDLGQLDIVHERICEAAVEEFGPGINSYSRQPV